MKKAMVLLLLLFLAGCSNTQKAAFEEDYPMFSGTEHVFRKVDFEETKSMLLAEKGTAVILFAYDPDFYECPFCFTCMPIINDAALEEKIDKIVYLDIFEMRKNITEEYQWLLNNLDSRVDDLLIRDGVKKIIVPDLYVLKDGEILDHHIATFPDESGGFALDLSEEQKNDLKEIYQTMFQLLKNK